VKNRVIVEGVNVRKRRTKPTQRNPQGGIVPQEMAIHVSNVMLIDPKTNTPTRIGHKKITDTKLNKERWVRISRKSGEVIQ
jgi:large subunit ribosomal protein L24